MKRRSGTCIREFPRMTSEPPPGFPDIYTYYSWTACVCLCERWWPVGAAYGPAEGDACQECSEGCSVKDQIRTEFGREMVDLMDDVLGSFDD